ncbi:MAG: hypothetical protein ACX93N_15305 [Pseudohaliea sp.]
MRSVFLAAALIAVPGHASDPFACVEEDVAAAFLGNWFQGSLPAYSTEATGDFTKLFLPEGFSLVGTRIDGTGRTVVYRSEQDKGTAYRAAIAAMENNGWWETGHPGHVRGAFNTGSRPSSALLCRDGRERSLVVSAVKRAGKTFISYAEGTGGMRCDFPGVPAWAASPAARRGAPMPDLYLPDNIAAGYPGATGGDFQQTS